jgi:TonB family protein
MTEVQRVKPKWPDQEWTIPGPVKRCTAIECKLVEVLVTVNPDGTVKDAVIKSGTDYGSGANDNALFAARNSTYKPKTVNCLPVEGTYLYRELFQRWD